MGICSTVCSGSSTSMIDSTMSQGAQGRGAGVIEADAMMIEAGATGETNLTQTDATNHATEIHTQDNEYL